MLGRRQRVLPLAILLLHLAAACGGGGDADADGATTTVPSTDGPIVLSTVAGLSDECAGLANLVSGIVQVFSGSSENIDQLFAAAGEGLPAGVRADVEILEKAADEVAVLTGGAGFNLGSAANMTPEELAAFEQAIAVFERDEVGDALDRISEYGEVACAQFVPSR